MKILFICKKHWKLMQTYLYLYKENPIFPRLGKGSGGGLYGLDFSVYIKPYLKKPRIIDDAPFKFDLTSYSPLPQTDAIMKKYPELFSQSSKEKENIE